MNFVSQKIVSPALQANHSPVSFGNKINPETVSKVADAAKDVFTKATKNPNSEAVKSGLKAIFAVVEKFITKNAGKIKEFIDKGAKGNNKFVRFMAVAAGLVMSILSVVGATTIFKDNVGEEKADVDAPVAEEVPDVDEAADAAAKLPEE